MNQGKWDVAKQKMARLNINILGISELKWTGMGKFNWGDIILISTTAGKKLLEEMELPSLSTKECKMQYLDATSKMTEWSRHTIQHCSNPSLCPKHWCQRNWHLAVQWRPTTHSITNTKKDVFFIIGDWLKCKSRKSKDIQSKFGTTSKFGLGVQMKQGKG